jgi:hypothetical protein
MRDDEHLTSSTGDTHPQGRDPWVGPDLPSLGSVLIGTVLFVTGGTLLFTVIGIPAGILLFAAGLGLMLTPKDRSR